MAADRERKEAKKKKKAKERKDNELGPVRGGREEEGTSREVGGGERKKGRA